MTLILASQSAARKTVLKNAGLEFEAIPADIDERQIEDEHPQETPENMANILAQAKALNVSSENSGALVIGSDQVLEFQGKILNKAVNDEAAKEKLKTLRGQTHHLISSVCVAKDNDVLWSHTDKAS